VGLAAGCVSALKPPPSLESLADALPRSGPGEVDDLLEAARIEYALRTPEKVRRAREIWLQAALADPARTEGLIGVARASAWLAEHEGEKEMRLQAAQTTVQAGQLCGEARPEESACAYWLGAGLGLQAQERRSTALDALPRIEEAFTRAAAEAPEMEHGGPHRALALLYARAPGWPTGPGDPDLAVEMARRALELAPDYPPNHLALGEALAAVEEAQESRDAYESALRLATSGPFGGGPDAPDWIREARQALGMDTE
jgi:tetratricopeptide (TPR) repeat protein